MNSKKCKSAKKTGSKNILVNIAKDRSGELLVEAIAAFVILLIIFVGITAIVMSSTNMNREANINSDKLDAAVQKIETSGAGTDKEDGTMTLRFSGTGLTTKDVTQDIAIKEQDEITFFVPIAQ